MNKVLEAKIFNDMFELMGKNDLPEQLPIDYCPRCEKPMIKDHTESMSICEECSTAQPTMFVEDAVRLELEDPTELNKMLSYYTQDAHW